MEVDLSAPLILDGAYRTNLFSDLPEDICIPKWILQNSDKLISLQKDFVEMGANILYTQTNYASSEHLKKFGLEDEMEQINTDLVRLTKSVSESVLVAGALSPVDLELEPFGETSYTELVHIFREQATVLAEAGVDIFVLDSMLSISQTRAAALALRKLQKPILVTMCVDENGSTIHGGNAVNALTILQELSISAFGLNGSCGANKMAEIISEMKAYAKIPLIAKPSALNFDDDEESLYEISPIEMAIEMKGVLEAGATIVGGCDFTTTAHVHEIEHAVKEYLYENSVTETTDDPPEQEIVNGDIVLADTNQIYNLFCDKIECSPPIECSVDMADIMLELEDESYDVILVEINNIDDAKDFAINAHLANLPVCFSSHDEISLRLALMLYNGRAMVDSNTSIDEETLHRIARKYGAVVY